MGNYQHEISHLASVSPHFYPDHRTIDTSQSWIAVFTSGHNNSIIAQSNVKGTIKMWKHRQMNRYGVPLHGEQSESNSQNQFDFCATNSFIIEYRRITIAEYVPKISHMVSLN